MITIIEPVRVALEHQAFNASLLQAVVAAYPGESVEFWAEPGHLQSVAQSLPVDLPISYFPLVIAPRRGNIWQRLRADFSAARLGLNRAKSPQQRVIFSSVTIPLLWACKALCYLPLSHRLGAIVHGGLAELRWNPRFNFFKRWTSLRWAMAIAPQWLSFWVLEQSIADALPRFAPELAGRFAVFPHPLPPDLVDVVHEPPRQPVVIGLLGLATPQKGLLRFLNVATALQGRGAEFHLVGRVHQDWRTEVAGRLGVLSQQPESVPMPRQLFVERARRLTYGAFFFDGEHYSLTASGVLLDCIALGIPLLGCRHPLFTALEAEVGEIGHFCRPGEEMALVNEVINNFDPIRHRRQSEAMLRLREPRMITALAVRLRELLAPR